MADALASAVAALQESADRLLQRLSETTAEELEAYVAERERRIGAVRAAAAAAAPDRIAACRPAVEALLAKDERIARRMEELRDEAAGKLKQALQAKTQRSAYEAASPADSYFFDRKK